MYDPVQSAYRDFHSTHTVSMHNDIFVALDNGQIFALVLLDLSTAFDTIDHRIHRIRLDERYGVKTDVPAAWTS